MAELKKITKEAFKSILNNNDVKMIHRFKNPIKVDGDTTTIYAVYKGLLQEVLIDTNDLDKIITKGYVFANWNGSKDNMYALYTERVNNKSKICSLHRFLTDCPDDKVVDHINRNSLDNRMSNLRIVTAGQNMLNKKTYKNTVKVNLTKKDKYYVFHTMRRFYNEDIAIEVQNKVSDILNHYSGIDAEQREYC